MKTYANKSNARRAAISAIKNLHPDGILKRLDLYYTITGDKASGFSFELVEPKKDKAPVAKPVRHSAAPQSNSKPVVRGMTQNGITRPRAGSKCDQVWCIAETFLKANDVVNVAEVKDAGNKQGLNKNTIVRQFYIWRAYKGL